MLITLQLSTKIALIICFRERQLNWLIMSILLLMKVIYSDPLDALEKATDTRIYNCPEFGDDNNNHNNNNNNNDDDDNSECSSRFRVREEEELVISEPLLRLGAAPKEEEEEQATATAACLILRSKPASNDEVEMGEVCSLLF